MSSGNFLTIEYYFTDNRQKFLQLFNIMQAGAWTGTITNTAIDHVAEMLDPELPTANDLIIHMDLVSQFIFSYF